MGRVLMVRWFGKAIASYVWWFGKSIGQPSCAEFKEQEKRDRRGLPAGSYLPVQLKGNYSKTTPRLLPEAIAKRSAVIY